LPLVHGCLILSLMTTHWQLRDDGPSSQRLALLSVRLWALLAPVPTLLWVFGWPPARTALGALSAVCCVLIVAALVVERRERRAS